MKKFNYSVRYSIGRLLTDDELNVYGDSGWELVSFTYEPKTTEHGCHGYSYIFKREIKKTELCNERL